MITLLLLITLQAQITTEATAALAALDKLKDAELIAYNAEAKATQDFNQSPAHYSLTLQHVKFGAAFLQARVCVSEALVHATEIQPNRPVPPQLTSLIRHECKAIQELERIVNTASPKSLQQAMQKTTKAFAKLTAHFRASEFDEHPPKK